MVKKKEEYAPIEYPKGMARLGYCPYCMVTLDCKDYDKEQPFQCLKLLNARGDISCTTNDFIRCPLLTGKPI